MEKFKLKSKFKPTGDQPEAIGKISKSLLTGKPFQTLLGVTGSGKTFTIANIIRLRSKERSFGDLPAGRQGCHWIC